MTVLIYSVYHVCHLMVNQSSEKMREYRILIEKRVEKSKDKMTEKNDNNN